MVQNNSNNAAYEMTDGEAWKNRFALLKEMPLAAGHFSVFVPNPDDFFFCVCYEELCAYLIAGSGQAYVWSVHDSEWSEIQGTSNGHGWDEYVKRAKEWDEPDCEPLILHE